MPAKIPEDEMWRTIEGYGIDRKSLEMTDPDPDIIEKMYYAIREIQKREIDAVRTTRTS
ncbi:MAG: hypothetical protein KGI33_12185 [Thaumarchaeota archaeon]|nr:hypothetical protein [Nitrososphaerota archaeon]